MSRYTLAALLPIACCVGVPLIAAAGVSVAVAAWLGGVALGAIFLAVAVTVIVRRARAHHRHPVRGERHP